MMLFIRRNMESLRSLIKAKNSRPFAGSHNVRRAAGAMFLLGCVSVGTLFGSSLIIGSDNGANGFPFGGPYYGNVGGDYQEAYASSDFSGPTLISSIDFFLATDFTGDLYSGTYTLSLSEISTNIGSLSSSNLASNIGSDNTVFETVTLSGSAPNELTFSGTPFLYVPSAGNLLLDISVSGGSGGKGVAFEDNEGVGTAVARYQNFGSGNGLGYGLVTEFDSPSSITAAPEPGMLSLLCCGLAGIFVRRLRRS